MGNVMEPISCIAVNMGRSVNDEINVIQVGRNYGWPQVAGYCDGKL
jgi:glucose/arabinose dehydrogenase